MLFTVTVDRLELYVLQQEVNKTVAAMGVVMEAFGEKKVNPEMFMIPTKNWVKETQCFKLNINVSPTETTLMFKVEPEFLADAMTFYSQIFNMAAIPTASFIFAMIKMGEHLDKATDEFEKKWFPKPLKAESVPEPVTYDLTEEERLKANPSSDPA